MPKMNWKHLSFIWSRASSVVAFGAYMTLQSYLAVQTWGIRAAPTVSIITVTVVACLLLLWMTLRSDERKRAGCIGRANHSRPHLSDQQRHSAEKNVVLPRGTWLLGTRR